MASVAARVAVGELQVAVAGGVESMTAVPMGGFHPQFHPKLAIDYPEAYIGMGNTAENVANAFDVDRAAQDAFALASQQKRQRPVKQDASPMKSWPSRQK